MECNKVVEKDSEETDGEEQVEERCIMEEKDNSWDISIEKGRAIPKYLIRRIRFDQFTPRSK